MKLKEKAKNLDPIIRIGKNGITENVIREIKKALEKRKLIKIKLLRPDLKNKDKRRLGKELAEKTNSQLIDTIGFVIVLYRK